MTKKEENKILKYVKSGKFSELSFLIFNTLNLSKEFLNDSKVTDFIENLCKIKFSESDSDELILKTFELVLTQVDVAISSGLIT
jgi:hypothetical protein